MPRLDEIDLHRKLSTPYTDFGMMEKVPNWITLDYLEFFCQRNHLVIGCRASEGEVWISALGPQPGLTADELQNILKHSSFFELRAHEEDAEGPLNDSNILTRQELEQRIRRLLN